MPEAAYAHLVNQQQDSYVPKEEVETLLMKYFPFASEMIYAYADKYYDTEKQEYSIWALHSIDSSEPTFRGAITSSVLNGNTLTVDCQWKWTAYPENPSTFESFSTSTTMIILTSDTEWFYESHRVNLQVS